MQGAALGTRAKVVIMDIDTAKALLDAASNEFEHIEIPGVGDRFSDGNYIYYSLSSVCGFNYAFNIYSEEWWRSTSEYAGWTKLDGSPFKEMDDEL